MLCFGSDEIYCNRAGVILFTHTTTGIKFLTGIYNKKQFTDFGGGVKKHETVVCAALRELHEETCDIFKKSVTLNHLKNSIALIYPQKSTVLFLVQIDPQWAKLSEWIYNKTQLSIAEAAFLEARRTAHDKRNKELTGICWLNEYTFTHLIYTQNRVMWSLLREIFLKNFEYIAWTSFLIQLMLGMTTVKRILKFRMAAR